jgi:hypothetical protein
MLPLIAVLSLGFAPLPKPTKPPTEVLVHVVENIDRIELICGTSKVSYVPGERWQDDLVARLKQLREENPALRRVVLRLNSDELTVTNYLQLRRVCPLAGYPEKPRVEDAGRR